MGWYGLPFWIAPGVGATGFGETTGGPEIRARSVGWWDRIVRVSVTPAEPGPGDEVSVTVSGRASADNVGIERKAVRVEDRRIVLDVYWSDNVPLVAVPCGGAWFGDSLQGHTTYCYSHAVGTCRVGAHTVLVKHWRFDRICGCKYPLFAVPASRDNGDGSDEADSPEDDRKPSWWSSFRGMLPWPPGHQK